MLLRSKKSENSYRSIQIYELKGKATIEREGIGVMDAIENLYLKSGDRIEVEADSFVRLKLDDDKYIMVEENSRLSIVAAGTKENSKTSIHLEEGAITNEIQNKLNESSSYEVTTPNSIMAVRGTVFRVEVIFDEKQEVYTRVSTFDGKVDAKAVYADERVEETVVPIEAGKETIIHFGEDETECEIELREINYEELPVQALESLQEVIDRDIALTGMEKESLAALIEEKKEEEAKNSEKEPDSKPEKNGTDGESTRDPEEIKAIIPAAGLGTRFLPATKSMPKEMLPIVDVPSIQYIVEEAVNSGIQEILIITNPYKKCIEDHFDKTFELEERLNRSGKVKELEMIERISEMAELFFVRQKEPKGLGHAILCARAFVGDEPFAVMLGDDVVVNREEAPAIRQL